LRRWRYLYSSWTEGKERKGKERKGKERKGKERKGKERKGKEREGKGREGKGREGKTSAEIAGGMGSLLLTHATFCKEKQDLDSNIKRTPY
jgi:hypothetical protein